MVTNTSIYKIGHYVFLLIVMFNGSNNQINEQRKCALPNNYIGSCVLIDDCPSIRDTLLKAPTPLSPLIVKYLESIYCGRINNMISVCCSNPTPQKEEIPSKPINIENHPNLRLLNPPICGPVETVDRIRNGKKAQFYEFPWMALLRYDAPDGLEYRCGGSIINDRYILTAAHCISGLRKSYQLFSVILGEYDTSTKKDCQEINGAEICLPPRQEFFISQLIVHPQYNNPRRANDIGLIRLNRSITFNEDHIKPVCLPLNEDLLQTKLKTLIVSGWGSTEKVEASPVLLKTTLKVIGMATCRAVHKRLQLSDNQFCAEGVEASDTCKGDSGGPLVGRSIIDRSNPISHFVQYGIVLGGVPGCGGGKSTLGVYIRVQNYMKWILDNIQE